MVFGGDPVDPTSFRAHHCANRRYFSSSFSRTNCRNRDHTLRRGFSSPLETVCRLSRTTGGERNRRRNSLVVCTEIDLAEKLGLAGFGKFPRASSSTAGRPRQVAADRARAGEKFLMAHFPASLSMNRLAGSSGTQKVCEATKSRNRTGSVISKSGRSGLSQMPASERRQLKVNGGVPQVRRCPKPCCCPPSRPRNGTTSSRYSGSLASLMECARSRRPPSSRSTQACDSIPRRRSLVSLVCHTIQ